MRKMYLCIYIYIYIYREREYSCTFALSVALKLNLAQISIIEPRMRPVCAEKALSSYTMYIRCLNIIFMIYAAYIDSLFPILLNFLFLSIVSASHLSDSFNSNLSVAVPSILHSWGSTAKRLKLKIIDGGHRQTTSCMHSILSGQSCVKVSCMQSHACIEVKCTVVCESVLRAQIDTRRDRSSKL